MFESGLAKVAVEVDSYAVLYSYLATGNKP